MEHSRRRSALAPARLGWLLVAGLLALYLASNLWASSNPWFPDALDEGLNNRYVLETGEHVREVVEALRTGNPLPEDWWNRLTFQRFPYGPLLFVSAGALDSLVSTRPWVRLLPVQLGCLLALLGVGAIARRLTGRRGAGLWAMGLLAALPMFLYYSRHLTTDMLLTGLCVATCWAAIRTQGYQRVGATALLGLVLGLGLLVKPLILHISFVPLVLYGVHTTLLGRAFPGEEKPRGERVRERLLLALPALGVGALIAGLVGWIYIRHLFGGAGHAEMEADGLELDTIWAITPWEAYPRSADWGTIQWLLFYPKMFVSYQAGLFGSVVLLGAGGYAWMRRLPGARWMGWSFLAVLVFFTFLGAKKWYYTLQLLPFAAVAAAVGIEGWLGTRPERHRGRWAAGLALAVLGAGLWAAWVPRPGLVFNRPQLLQVAPGPQLPSAADLASKLGEGGTLLVVTPMPLKGNLQGEANLVYSYLHMLDVETLRNRVEWKITPARSRDQFLCSLEPDEHFPCDQASYVLVFSSDGAPWVTPEVLAGWPNWGERRWLDEDMGTDGHESRDDVGPGAASGGASDASKRTDEYLLGMEAGLVPVLDLPFGTGRMRLSRLPGFDPPD